MTEVELKKLNRAELLTMLMSVTQKCDDLEEELEEARRQIREREIHISESGTLAEAMIRVNGVVEAADKAASEYLAEIRKQYEQQESITQELVSTRQTKLAAIEQETKNRCAIMVETAKAESQAYWDEVYNRLKEYCATTESLKDMLGQLNRAGQ